jgi:hypothetical protein
VIIGELRGDYQRVRRHAGLGERVIIAALEILLRMGRIVDFDASKRRGAPQDCAYL